MYLKPGNKLYRKQQTPSVTHVFILLLLIAGGGIVVYNIMLRNESPIISSNTPTPQPTATPSPLLSVAEAEDAYWAGDINTAIDSYQRALDIEPNQVDVYIELARLLIHRGRPERALEMAREALHRQPENPHALLMLGLSYEWLGLLGEAIDAYQAAIELDPTSPEAYAYLAEAYIDSGNWYGANDAIATAELLDDANVVVRRNSGYVLENQGNYYGAMEAYREALELHNRLVHLYLSIGRNAEALGNLSLAQETYEDAIEVDPGSAVAHARLGRVYLYQGEYEKAEVALKEALALDPVLGDAYGNLATLYFQRLNYEDAIENFRPALRYGEAKNRRRTVYLLITEESVNGIGEGPADVELARAYFIHPLDPEAPLRGVVFGSGEGSPIQGHVRLDVMTGRYTISLAGLPPAPAGKVYMGWFMPLVSAGELLVHTEAIFPAPDGRVEISGETGAIKGPSIENYYLLALAYYYLDDCPSALAYIEVALRIDPQDANSLVTWEYCSP